MITILSDIENCILTNETFKEIINMTVITIVAILLTMGAFIFIDFIQEYILKSKKTVLDYLELFSVYLKNGWKLGEEMDINEYINDNRLKKKLNNIKVIVQKNDWYMFNAWVYKYEYSGIIFIDHDFFEIVKYIPVVLETILWHELYHSRRLGKRSDTELYATQYSLMKINERYGMFGVIMESHAGMIDNDLLKFREYSKLVLEECTKITLKDKEFKNRKFLRLR